MTLTIGFTDDLTNSQYAPLAVLAAHYHQHQVLQPLEQVSIPMKGRDFSPTSKLTQVLISLWAGCETLSEVNTKLKAETGLAAVWGWERFADQSSLSRTLDALTQMNIEQLRQSTTAIWQAHSQATAHDWRGFLWLDFDLSGLPCGPLAQASHKGYFSDKKTSLAVNWPASAPSITARRSGRRFMRATAIPSSASSPPSWRLKLP